MAGHCVWLPYPRVFYNRPLPVDLLRVIAGGWGAKARFGLCKRGPERVVAGSVGAQSIVGKHRNAAAFRAKNRGLCFLGRPQVKAQTFGP